MFSPGNNNAVFFIIIQYEGADEDNNKGTNLSFFCIVSCLLSHTYASQKSSGYHPPFRARLHKVASTFQSKARHENEDFANLRFLKLMLKLSDLVNEEEDDSGVRQASDRRSP